MMRHRWHRVEAPVVRPLFHQCTVQWSPGPALGTILVLVFITLFNTNTNTKTKNSCEAPILSAVGPVYSSPLVLLWHNPSISIGNGFGLDVVFGIGMGIGQGIGIGISISIGIGPHFHQCTVQWPLVLLMAPSTTPIPFPKLIPIPIPILVGSLQWFLRNALGTMLELVSVFVMLLV